ncbi:uncharacterized protein LOC131429000 [Malaya genurostris]|uniref:uncharacterized protein LOC131429000 n=1 Tax=Malaya genurostris TaxID=325434 RepID=UPI0026F3C55A|nr:uncharacterized protein LOC131429000 [Malaya genurostris]
MSVQHSPKSKSDTDPPFTPIKDQLREKRKKIETKTMEEQLKVLVRQRKAVEGKLTRIRDALYEPDDVLNPNLKNLHFLQLHLKTVESCYKEYNEFQNAIYSLAMSDERRDEQEDRYVVFEMLYNDLSIRLNSLIAVAMKVEDRVTVSSQVVPAAAVATTHLPPLNVPLPSFDGSYENWFSFKCIFQTIMARYENESPAIKLYHLRNSLIGKAAGIIDQDLMNNNDYDAAWALLTDRFEDRRLIIDKHIEALFNLPIITKESSGDLRKLVDTCSKNIDALKNLELPLERLSEQMLINVISTKLDKDTRKAWEMRQTTGQLPTYDATLDFLKDRCRILEKIDTNTKVTTEKTKQLRSAAKCNTLVATVVAKCLVCQDTHELWKCEQFKKSSVSEKYNLLRKIGSCFNCLQRGHRTNQCPSSSSCKKCGKRHHTQLHLEDVKSDVHQNQMKSESEAASKACLDERQGRNDVDTSKTETISTLCAQVDSIQKQTLLSTAIIMVFDCGGVLHPCRALLDSASQSHFITERFVNLLKLQKESVSFSVNGFNGVNTRVRFMVQVRIKSRINNFSVNIDALIAPKIIADLPERTVYVREWDLPTEIELADPAFYKKHRIDMLIGAEVFWKLIKADCIQLAPGLPTLRDTEFGWIVGGAIQNRYTTNIHTLCTVKEDIKLSDILERFWKFEGSDEIQKHDSSMQVECLKHFQRTHYRNDEGRYIVRLPFNQRKNDLGDSWQMALRRYLNLERRLNKEPLLKKQYTEFIHEYERLGHMHQVNVEQDGRFGPSYFIPHHCILKPSSTTTKLRVVFDGSAKTSTGTSLNDVLMIGPTVQNELVAILMNFRCFRYVFTADIPKMYRQVGIHTDDAKFQRIIWRDDPSQPLKVFELQTVTYGLASSPFHATMALNQLAEDSESKYPLAAKVVRKCFYIDDVLTGAQSLEATLQLQSELTELLKDGCFDAHKWCSNSTAVLEGIPEELRGTALNMADIDSKTIIKTLGVAWNPTKDWFSFTVTPSDRNSSEVLTRRQILSEVARIFDPLGIIGPVVTEAKLILREVCSQNAEWDDPVSEIIAKRWKIFREELPVLNELQIPRWILAEDVSIVELHGFCDSSNQAYGSCLYTRLVYANGSSTMRLICSKSRILPKAKAKIKPITTPRSELLAAVLLSRLVNKFLASVDLIFHSINLWSDSQIALCWLRKPPAELERFVSNRVIEIQRLTSEFQWRYIATDMNPADIISRGEHPSKLIKRRLWWDGPGIFTAGADLPDDAPSLSDDDLPELKQTVVLALVADGRMKLFDNVSNYDKLRRCMAYAVRFALYIMSRREQMTKGMISTEELVRAEKIIVRLVQAEMFRPELVALRKNSNGSHRLRGLAPFIDTEDALKRFVSRRGLVSTIYSDNATNFVGASNELEQLRLLFEDKAHQADLSNFCTSRNIVWRFIPPRSPHFGGIWEAGVKSVKHHLKRVIGNRILSYEEFYTVLTQIEAVLNSRPLTQSSDDPNDFTAITPAHFLIGREMNAILEPSYLNLKESSLSRWQLVQTMQQHFWKRWTHEYLPELKNRQKWCKKTTFKIGALVLIADSNAPPAQWSLGRIIAVHPGSDDLTRVVSINTTKGIFKRAVTEICPLPLDVDERSED